MTLIEQLCHTTPKQYSRRRTVDNDNDVVATKNFIRFFSEKPNLKRVPISTDNLRKIIHLSALLVPILADIASKPLVLSALSLITIVYTLEEVLRLRGRHLPIITPFTLRMSRPGETAGIIARPIYLAVGIILALALFPRLISYASIAIAGVGDPVAAYVGRRYGRRWLTRRKTLEGSIAGFIASVLLASLIVSPLLALAGSAASMLMEIIGIPDDNLTMPIAAGVLMTFTTLPLH